MTLNLVSISVIFNSVFTRLLLPYQTMGEGCYSWFLFSNFPQCPFECSTLLKLYCITFERLPRSIQSLFPFSTQIIESLLCNFLPNSHEEKVRDTQMNLNSCLKMKPRHNGDIYGRERWFCQPYNEMEHRSLHLHYWK